MKICSVGNCGRQVIAKGYCPKHYDCQKKYGSPEPRRKTENGAGRRFVEASTAHTSDECLIWPFPHSGYPEVKVNGKRIRAHRYMCLLVHGEPPEGKPEAAHSCGNGHLGCVNPNHIRWLSPSENQLERKLHGTSNHGERNGRRKIDAETALQIRNDRRSIKAIAEEFGLSRGNIWLIKTGRSWPDLGQAA